MILIFFFFHDFFHDCGNPVEGGTDEDEGMFNGSRNHAVSTNRRTKVPLPMRVASPEAGVSIKTYALLDITLCNAWLMKALRIRGRRGTMSLATLNGVQSRAPTKVMRLVGADPTEKEKWSSAASTPETTYGWITKA